MNLFVTFIIPIIILVIWEFGLREIIVKCFKKIGYVCAKIFRKEPPLSEMLEKLRKICKKTKETNELLKGIDFPGLAIDGCIEIIHSHAYRGWHEDNIDFLTLKTPSPSLPNDLLEYKENNRPNPPNNGKFRLYKYIPDSTERPNLQIQLITTDYFSTYPIQRNIFNNILCDESGEKISPFRKYGNNLLDFGEHKLPNIVCLHVIVALSKTKLLLTQRMEKKDVTDWEPGKWSCSIEEQMTVKQGTARLDKTFFDTTYAGLKEELGLEQNDIDDIKILSIVLESDGLVVVPIALATVNSDIKEIKASCQMKAQDGINREILNITTIDWDLDSIKPILLRNEVKTNDNTLIKPEEWHVTSRMRFLTSLFNKFSIQQTLNLFQEH